MGLRQINPIANASRTETTIQTAYRQFQLPFASFIQNQIAKVFHFCSLIHRDYYNFATDFRKAVRHTRTKERYWNFLVQSNSRKVWIGTKRVATSLTLRIYTIPKGRTIYSHSVSGCCLSVPRQCEKPDWKISIDTVLTLFVFNHLDVPMGDEGQV